jgi:putative ABC transport system ATP-binding protein
MEILDELNNTGTTVAIITHDESLAAKVPRRVAIRDGEIIHDTKNGTA